MHRGRVATADPSDSSSESWRWRFDARKLPFADESFRPFSDTRIAELDARKRSLYERAYQATTAVREPRGLYRVPPDRAWWPAVGAPV